MPSVLFLKLAASYFFYFAILGLIVPYLGLFLDEKGFSSREIGEIFAITTATKIIGPGLWAMLADKTGKLLTIIRIGALLSFISFSLLIPINSYWLVTLFLSLFMLFWAAILPQIEVLTQNTIRRNAKVYARIRLWGSIGFIVLSVISGELISIYPNYGFVIIGSAVLMALWGVTLLLKQPSIKQPNQNQASSIIDKLFSFNFLLFFLSGIFLQISFAPFYSFFSLYLRDLAYPNSAAGLLIGLGVVAEVFVFIYAGKIFKFINIKQALFLSIALSALRWFIMATYAESSWLLSTSQLLHAAGFALFHSASILFLQQHFANDQQNRAQAIYIGGVYGLGGVIGAYFAGVFWLNGAGAEHTFMLATYTAIIGAMFIVFMPNKHNHD